MLTRRLVLTLVACLVLVAPVAAGEPAPVQILERVPLPPDDDPWWCSPAAAWTARQQHERAEGIFEQRCLEWAALRAAEG